MRIVTIGVYGFSEGAFFEKLRAADVDVFCDVRSRRGLRGRDYAFANSARLQKRLAELGIRYLHFQELAPTPELRKRQADTDVATRIQKRKRSVLGEAFILGYREAISEFDSRKFIEALGQPTSVAALFCVERDPSACHRSLLTERIQSDLGSEIEVRHLTPDA